MIRKSIILLVSLVLVVLSACQVTGSDSGGELEPSATAQSDTPTPEPTKEATPVPTEIEPIEGQDKITASADLLSNSWQWTSFTSPVEQFDIDGAAFLVRPDEHHGIVEDEIRIACGGRIRKHATQQYQVRGGRRRHQFDGNNPVGFGHGH